MFNQESLKSIARETETSKIVFDSLTKRERFRRATNLNQHQAALLNQGYKIVHEDYLKVFKRLQDIGVGTLILGRKGKPNRFVWNYNLKNVGMAATGSKDVGFELLRNKPGRPVGAIARVKDDVVVGMPKRGRGRPPGAKNKTNFTTINGQTELVIKLTPEVKEFLSQFITFAKEKAG